MPGADGTDGGSGAGTLRPRQPRLLARRLPGGARPDTSRCLSLARAIGASATEAEVLYALGFLYSIEHDYAAARSAFTESRQIADARCNDPLAEANAMFGLAFTGRLEGRYRRGTRPHGGRAAPVRGGRRHVRHRQRLRGHRPHPPGSGRSEAGRGYHLRELTGALDIGDRTMVAMALSDLASLEASPDASISPCGCSGPRAGRRNGSVARRPTSSPSSGTRCCSPGRPGYAEADIEATHPGRTGLSDEAVVRVANHDCEAGRGGGFVAVVAGGRGGPSGQRGEAERQRLLAARRADDVVGATAGFVAVVRDAPDDDERIIPSRPVGRSPCAGSGWRPRRTRCRSRSAW